MGFRGCSLRIRSPCTIPARQKYRLPAIPKIFTVNVILLQSPIYAYKVKGVNYYPSSHPWAPFYTDDDWWATGRAEYEIKRELMLLRNIGVNVIRTFAIYTPLGGAVVDPTKRSYLENLITWAGELNIKTMVTLFDGLSGADFDPPQWDNHKSHLNGIVGYFSTNTNVLAWDLKNEYQLIYTPENRAKTEAWGREMILYIKKLDTIHPVLADSTSASVHWFNDLLDTGFSDLYKPDPKDNGAAVDEYYTTPSIHKGRPYLCSETGWSHAILGLQSTDTRDKGSLWVKKYLEITLKDLATRDCGALIWCGFEYPTLPYDYRERWFGIITSPTHRYKESARMFAAYKPIPQPTPRRLWVDAWDITEDYQDFEVELGLTVISGTWGRVSDTQQDGTTGYVAEQTETAYIADGGGTWDGKAAVTSAVISTEHMHVEAYCKLEVTTGSQEMGILLNFIDINNLYRIYANRYYNVLGLKKLDAGTEILLAETPVTIESGVWYKISATIHRNTYGEVTYNNIRCFLNDGDAAFLAYDDDTPLPAGKSGLYTAGDTIARFNDFHAYYITKTRTLL